MRVLVLLPDSPDPWSNTAARYYAPMLKGLAAYGDDVTALAIRRRADDRQELGYFNDTGVRFRLFDPAPSRPLWERKLRSLWRSGWELAVSDFGRAARREAQEDYDVILAEMPETARIVERDRRLILSLHHFRFHDLSYALRRGSVREKVDVLQAWRSEISPCRRATCIRATSRRLERLARQHGVKAPIRVVPICVDPALYHPVAKPATPTVGVLGSMFWPPSRRAATHFIERIVPRIRAACPEARFLVGGWRAQQYLGELAVGSGVELLDSFPEPAAAFARLSVLVYTPPVGTGMKVKVLEALAYGVPVVVNEEGFEGLEVDPQPAVRLGRSDDEIGEQITDLLLDASARRRASEEGRRCIERSFSPLAVTTALRGLLEARARGVVS